MLRFFCKLLKPSSDDEASLQSKQPGSMLQRQQLELKEIYITPDLQTAVKCHDQVIFRNGESGKRIWEAGIVMARFLQDHLIHKEDVDCGDELPESLPGLDEESLWDVQQILELGSGTGIGVMPLVRHYAQKAGLAENLDEKMPGLQEIIISDHMLEL